MFTRLFNINIIRTLQVTIHLFPLICRGNMQQASTRQDILLQWHSQGPGDSGTVKLYTINSRTSRILRSNRTSRIDSNEEHFSGIKINNDAHVAGSNVSHFKQGLRHRTAKQVVIHT